MRFLRKSITWSALPRNLSLSFHQSAARLRETPTSYLKSSPPLTTLSGGWKESLGLSGVSWDTLGSKSPPDFPFLSIRRRRLRVRPPSLPNLPFGHATWVVIPYPPLFLSSGYP